MITCKTMLQRCLAAFSGVILFTAFLGAQDVWTQLRPAQTPPDATGGMCFDSSRGVTVFIHSDGFTVLTPWEFDGQVWTAKVPSSLSGRMNYQPLVAYDSARQRTYVLCWAGTQTVLRSWDGAAWKVEPTNGLSSEFHEAMVYDSVHDRIVVVGTEGGASVAEYDSSAGVWTVVKGPVNPPRRDGTTAVFDPNTSTTIMYGGVYPMYVKHRDTWSWDGYSWTELSITSPPPMYGFASMVYDSSRQSSLLFGGESEPSYPGQVLESNETWELVAGDWRRIYPATSPPKRKLANLAYDSKRGKVVMFGGVNSGGPMTDTWEFTWGTSATYTTQGSGCAGSRGVPYLEPRQGETPRIGQQFTLQLKNLPLTGQAFMFLGVSNTHYGNLGLPFRLDGIGMPGCSLLVSGDDVFPISNVLGVAAWTITIPNIPGFKIYNQGIVADPRANSLGLVVTNAGEGVIGS